MKLDTRSMGLRIWLYFSLFSGIIMIMLWLLQTVFLASFYESMKIKNITTIASEIKKNYGQSNFQASLDSFSYKNSLLIYVTDDEWNILYSSDEHGPSSWGDRAPMQPPGMNDFPDPQRNIYRRPLPRNYVDFTNRLNQSKEDYIVYIDLIDDAVFKGKTLVYGAMLPDAILYISTTLDPVDSTTDILRTMLIYVTAIELFLGLIIALFIARKLSRPISNITKTAGELARGNYSIVFQKGYYSEIDRLADALNHTARELSKLEGLRRDLIANISHDLRTPLTMIKAYAELIRDISGDVKEKRETHLRVIISETDRLSLLVNDILDLSVIQSDFDSIKTDNINLSGILKNVMVKFELLSENDSGFNISAAIDSDVYILGDGRRMEQVFYNLIGNAVNYSSDDKKIDVKLIDLGGKVRFEVTDNGNGIPDEELDLIWDRHYKSKNHTRSTVSTGLGLSIVKNILELHQASYGAKSCLGSGSTFWFEIKK